MLKVRGGYSLDQTHRVRLRISPRTYDSLKLISDKTNFNLARLIRHLLEAKLDDLKSEQDSLTESSPDHVHGPS